MDGEVLDIFSDEYRRKNKLNILEDKTLKKDDKKMTEEVKKIEKKLSDLGYI